MKEKERMNKISPNYNSSNIENYFNSNFNENFKNRKIMKDDIFGNINYDNNNLNNKKNKKK